MEINLGYKNWMVLKQVVLNKDGTGPLGSMCPSVMAWAISHWPPPRLASLALSWAGLPTQVMAPDNVNVASRTLPRLSPSPNDHHHRTGWSDLGLSLWLLYRPALPSHPMSSTICTCHAWAGGGAALLSLVKITCISRQCGVSGQLGFLASDWVGDWDGSLPNASGSSGPFQPLGGVRVWPSFWILFQVSVHLGHSIWWPLPWKQWPWIETLD